jgi:2-polyprenyl-3-methyl-5-hydroxy-6-metoxy-1,4-benzoquinol methylase
MTIDIRAVERFWNSNPCNGSLSQEQEDRKKYFDEIERVRYRNEPHVPLVARFADYRDNDVLEVGCSIGTDGLQFARAGARYTGFDLTRRAIELATERFDLSGVRGTFGCGNAEELPFPDCSFDHVYSFGVIHHSPNTAAILEQIHRVLRPGGTVCVMVYNRSSINYHLEIMFLRKLIRLLLYPSFMPRLLAAITGFDRAKLEGHRGLLLSRPNMTKAEWISVNTDGPDCPLAKVYNRREALALFNRFASVRTEVFHFDRAHWSFLGRLMPDRVAAWLGRHFGWHRIVYAAKKK